MSTTLLPAPRDPRAADLLRAAFGDVHGPRLHGFALLLTLGDRSLAAATAGRALAAGTARADELRHPERAAAWLRARVMHDVRRSGGQPARRIDDGDAALAELGLAAAAIDAFAQLSLEERAALIAAAIERLDISDVAAVLGRTVASSRNLVRAARARYLELAERGLRDSPTALPAGDISRRIDEAAAWAVGTPRGVAAQRVASAP